MAALELPVRKPSERGAGASSEDRLLQQIKLIVSKTSRLETTVTVLQGICFTVIIALLLVGTIHYYPTINNDIGKINSDINTVENLIQDAQADLKPVPALIQNATALLRTVQKAVDQLCEVAGGCT